MPGKHMRPSSDGVGGHQMRASAPVRPRPVKGAAPSREGEGPRGTSLASRLSVLLLIVGVVLLLVAGGMWGVTQYRYWKLGQTNEKLAQNVTIRSETSDPAGRSGCPVEVDWAALKAINDDVVGWIYVPGTDVNYPVYQGETNDTYLRTNAYGEWSDGGQIFLDYENAAPGMVDRQSVIYGHHMLDGSMFQPLAELDKQEAFDATDTIWYVTEKEEYELTPLFMYYVEPTDTTVRHLLFASDDEFRAYLMEKLELSVTSRADAAQVISGATRVLTMSTCNYYDGYGRSILVAIEKSKTPEATQAAAATEVVPPADTGNVEGQG